MKIFECLLIAGIVFYSHPVSVVFADKCTDGLRRAMQEEGLTGEQINLICKKALLYDEDKVQNQERPTIDLTKKRSFWYIQN